MIITAEDGTGAADVVHYRPPEGWVGDVIPFVHRDRLWLFYLLEIRADPKPGTGWAALSTTDLTDWTDHGVVLPSGGAGAEDVNCYTGSLVSDGERVHLFYTGNDPDRPSPDGEGTLQLAMHATSDGDLTRWTRHPEHTFGAAPGYGPADWRDPFVFREADDQPWRMLLAARRTTGPWRRRGIVAQLTSDDLITWTLAEPFWDPRRYITQECPDVFRQGDWWYLVYSEFSDAFVTRYRMARTLDGPWIAPPLDTLDGRAFYAAKTAEFRGRRLLIGWIATREGDRDDGAWQWAGTMAIRELRQRPDGTLDVALPAETPALFGPTDDRPVLLTDPWTPDRAEPADGLRLFAPDGYRAMIGDRDLGEDVLAELEIEIAPGTTEFGLLLRATPDGDHAYQIRLEPQRGRMVFDRWPRLRTGDGQWEVSGDQPYQVDLERPCPLPPGRHTLQVLAEGTALVAVVDDRVCLSARIYDRPGGRLGCFVGDGEVLIERLDLRRRQRIGP